MNEAIRTLRDLDCHIYILPKVFMVYYVDTGKNLIIENRKEMLDFIYDYRDCVVVDFSINFAEDYLRAVLKENI